MRITRLQAENFKRLQAVDITPGKDLVVINGENGAGKTSVLDSIEAALGGKRSVPGKPVHTGKRKARVVLETEDLVITRKFRPDGSSTIEVKGRDGGVHKSPQTMLDNLLGRLSFDPLEFSRRDPKGQQATLRAIVGVDLSAFDAQRKEAYEERTGVSRDLKRAEARLDGMPHHEDAPAEEVSVVDLMTELSAARGHNMEVSAEQEKLTRREAAVEYSAEEVERLVVSLSAARVALEEDRNECAFQVAKCNSLQAKPTDDIEAKIAGAGAANAKARENAERDRVETEVSNLKDSAESLTESIEAVDEAKADAIAAAEFPVEGLGFSEDGVTMQGLPFAQASGAEQLKASVAIGMALNPELRVLLIRDGSLLDKANLAVLQEMAAERDFQCWVERVSSDGETGILIEDGQVVEHDEAAAE